jgi:exopolysaccharide biosynthesis polyprenyl glycosylphosphotransferase
MAKQPPASDPGSDAAAGTLPAMATDGRKATSRSRQGSGFSLQTVERRALLLVGDAAAWFVAGVLVVAVLHPPRFSFATGPRSMTIASIAVLSWWLWAWVNGAYDLDIASKESSILPVLVKAAVLQTLAFVALAYTARGFTGRTVWALWLIAALALVASWRTLYLTLLTLPVFAKDVLFAGSDDFLVELSRIVRDHWASQYRIVGFAGNDGALAGDLEQVGRLDQLPLIATRMNVSEVVVGSDAFSQRRILEELVECRNMGVKITPASDLYEQLLQQVPVAQIDHHWIMDLPNRAQQNRMYVMIKRLVDIVLAAIGLVIFLVLLPFIALAIRIDSGRPIFYSQIRTGLHGRTFRVWKLRTMRPNAEYANQAQWTVPGDQRITRAGRFLRRARLDELPQLLNIVKGEMSFVGPRPERPEFVDQLEMAIPFYRTRLAVKPGLTGWAQVNEGYGSSVEDAITKLQYDLYYVKQQSLMLDALIIFRTPSIVGRLGGR